MTLSPEETKFLQKQAQIHLLEAHRALANAAHCVAAPGSSIGDDIDVAISSTLEALRKTGMEVPAA
jgi:hypothetical protein